MTETKNEKFIRLSEARVGKAEFAIGQLHHLNSHHYEFSEQEAEALIFRLRASVDNAAAAFGLEPINDIETPEPERPAAPVPTPAPVAEAPRTFEEGELNLNPEESLHMLHIGPQVGAAIEAITDGKPEEAKGFLLNLMRS